MYFCFGSKNSANKILKVLIPFWVIQRNCYRQFSEQKIEHLPKIFQNRMSECRKTCYFPSYGHICDRALKRASPATPRPSGDSRNLITYWSAPLMPKNFSSNCRRTARSGKSRRSRTGRTSCRTTPRSGQVQRVYTVIHWVQFRSKGSDW